MLASKGYPGSYAKGTKVAGFELNDTYFVSGLRFDANFILVNWR